MWLQVKFTRVIKSVLRLFKAVHAPLKSVLFYLFTLFLLLPTHAIQSLMEICPTFPCWPWGFHFLPASLTLPCHWGASQAVKNSASQMSGVNINLNFNEAISYSKTSPRDPCSLHRTHTQNLSTRRNFSQQLKCINRSYFFSDEFLKGSTQLVSEFIHIFFNSILSIISFLLQLVLHHHLPLGWRKAHWKLKAFWSVKLSDCSSNCTREAGRGLIIHNYW